MSATKAVAVVGAEAEEVVAAAEERAAARAVRGAAELGRAPGAQVAYRRAGQEASVVVAAVVAVAVPAAAVVYMSAVAVAVPAAAAVAAASRDPAEAAEVRA